MVSIQVRQPKKKEAAPIFRGGFFMPEETHQAGLNGAKWV